MLGDKNSKRIFLLNLLEQDAEALSVLLQQKFELVSTKNLRQLKSSELFDLVLVDSRFTSLSEIETLVRQRSGVQVAFINGDDTRQIMPYLCIQGVNGLFKKNEKAELILRGIDSMLNGELWFPREILPEIINSIKLDASHTADQLQTLSNKEREILIFLTRGSSNNQIAADLNISFHTVKTHVYNLYKKLGVKNRAEAVKLANSLLTKA